MRRNTWRIGSFLLLILVVFIASIPVIRDFYRRHREIFNTIAPEYAAVDVGKLLKVDSQETIASIRQSLLTVARGEPTLTANSTPDTLGLNLKDPRYSDIKALERIDRLQFVEDNGIDSVVYFFRAARPNKRLALYCQGHDGDFSLGKSTIEALLSAGYDVLAFSMPLLGMNSRPHITTVLGRLQLTNHNQLQLLDRPLRYFIDPVTRALNFALKESSYEQIAMVGLSGGAWLTTIYAAIDPRIERSYPVAGTLPFYLRSGSDRDWGDFEQTYAPFYAIADYFDLYVMGSVGPRRKQLQILNRYDSCCFGGIKYRTYEQAVTNRAAALGGDFQVFLDETHTGHLISPTAIQRILEDLAL